MAFEPQNLQEEGSKHWSSLNTLDFATAMNNLCLLLDITITTQNFPSAKVKI
jgi:hypothetical protein